MQKYTKTRSAPFAAPEKLDASHDAFARPQDYCWSFKLNGHRGMLVLQSPEPLLRSRKGHVLNHLIQPAIDIKYIQKLQKLGITHLEGELVALSRNGRRFASNSDSFLALSSAAAGKKGTDIEVAMFVFDVATTEPLPFDERLQLFRSTLDDTAALGFIRYLPHYTPFVSDMQEVSKLFVSVYNSTPWMTEGIVVRPLKASYNQPQMAKLRKASDNTTAKLISMDMETKTGTVQWKRHHLHHMLIGKKLMPLLMATKLPCAVVIDMKQRRITNIGTEWM